MSSEMVNIVLNALSGMIALGVGMHSQEFMYKGKKRKFVLNCRKEELTYYIDLSIGREEILNRYKYVGMEYLERLLKSGLTS